MLKVKINVKNIRFGFFKVENIVAGLTNMYKIDKNIIKTWAYVMYDWFRKWFYYDYGGVNRVENVRFLPMNTSYNNVIINMINDEINNVFFNIGCKLDKRRIVYKDELC